MAPGVAPPPLVRAHRSSRARGRRSVGRRADASRSPPRAAAVGTSSCGAGHATCFRAREPGDSGSASSARRGGPRRGEPLSSHRGSSARGGTHCACDCAVQSILFVKASEQASHNGDLVHAVEAGVLTRDAVSELGDVLIGSADGRTTDRDITVFDSTGLAIQDLAIAIAAMERAGELDPPVIRLQGMSERVEL
ncbi:MAG: hypothetical protein E6G60_12775 [Actinobacteria bacterium]|nr:MAG: hypothetical protein E6G60_12775 [Actinomycetota bacterium]